MFTTIIVAGLAFFAGVKKDVIAKKAGEMLNR